jgi:hypothetical protein
MTAIVGCRSAASVLRGPMRWVASVNRTVRAALRACNTSLIHDGLTLRAREGIPEPLFGNPSNRRPLDEATTVAALVAEEVGFEPTEGFPSHDFQSCRFGRSRTPPWAFKRELNTGSQGYPSPLAGRRGSLFGPRSTAVVGSRATTVRESSQGWKPAALSELSWVPRIAWPPLWTSASYSAPLA